MQRITRAAGSFAIVLIAYWAYALLVVPWIEPSEASPGGNTNTQVAENHEPAADLLELQQKSLQGLGFKPDAWELKNPKILESDRAKLLLQEYRNLGDGRVEITPCTIIFPYDGPAEDEAQRRRQTVILEAPGGALLQFDQALDLTRAKVGRLIGGQLRGEVTIRSDWKQPGPEDDLLIVTRDIQLTERTIATSNPVEFRWGPHFGSGRDMLITLLAAERKPGQDATGPNVAGVESFELRHVERLHLDLATDKPTSGPGGPVPVEIQCRGPFRFDVVHRVATFQDRVDVLKPNPGGPSDQIACELLSLFFTDRKLSVPASPPPADAQDAHDSAAGSFNLVAERLEAKGNPVVVTAPSQKLAASGPRIEYNLLAKTIAMDGAQEVSLHQGPNEIHAKSLWYQAAEGGRLGRVLAAGPGWLHGQSADREDQQLEAAWRDQLRVVPQDGKQVISLTGGAELKSPGKGRLQARDIFLWLDEAAPAGGGSQPRLRPDRMLASTDVHIESPQICGSVEQLELMFEGEAVGTEASGEQRPATAVAGGVASPPLASPPAVPPAQPVVKTPQQQFEVAARQLHARLSLGGKQMNVSQLLLEEGVRFFEKQTSKPGERPLLITGDRIEAADATSPHAIVTVTGRPAHFEARGLGLTGASIHLDRGANQLRIDGVGQMDLPLGGGMPGMPGQQASPAASGSLTVDWRRGMVFDGRRATFDGSVVAASPQQQMCTETLVVQMRQPIQFSNPRIDGQPQVETILCHGAAAMENRSFDAQRQIVSLDRMEVANLAVNVLSGELNAGPGWLNSVRRGGAVPFGGRPNSPAAVPAGFNGQPGGQNAVELNCLHVKYRGSISGNLLRRQLTFHDQIRTAYAPVDRWDAMLTTENPDQLGPKGVTLRCDQLDVNEWLLPVGGRRAFEITATGNAIVENTTFTARGNRIAYAEAKDLLILEGDGRNDAELFRQVKVGDPASKAAAQKIWYYPKTNRLKVDGARSLEISQAPGGAR